MFDLRSIVFDLRSIGSDRLVRIIQNPAKLSLLAGQLFLIDRQISPYVRNILRFRDCFVASNRGVETATVAKRQRYAAE